MMVRQLMGRGRTVIVKGLNWEGCVSVVERKLWGEKEVKL